MATEILAVAATAAVSSDVTIAAGEQLTVSLKTTNGSPPPSNSVVIIKLKDDSGAYNAIEQRLTALTPSFVIAAAGTYQFARQAGAAVGVFSG